MSRIDRADALVIGGGIAGATCALRLAQDRERHVVVLTHRTPEAETASSWAQGGIATLGEDDSVDAFAADVEQAGAGLSFPPAVRLLAERGPDLLERVLIDEAGVAFDRRDGRLAYGLEAAHSRRRILHVGDGTGAAIMERLGRRLRETPNIEVREGRTAIDLLTFPHHALDRLEIYRPPRCHGAYVLRHDDGEVEAILAPATVLATGGLGQIYLHTTNPKGARGDGLAMAYRAGARVVNAEYVQFHPTAFDQPETTKLLVSEAVRGEGARLLTPDGRRLMDGRDERLELAPRDVVARAIFREMITHGYPHVFLDLASAMDPDAIRRRFPKIHEACLAHDVDVTARPIPVVPAAHYFCGGVLADLDARTTIPGLYAAGEIACTGVHGANRLASTSLLEGLVWGAQAADAIAGGQDAAPPSPDEVPGWDSSGLSHDADPALIRGDRQTIRSLMWHYVGLLRSRRRLDRAVEELRRLWLNIEDFYKTARLSDGLVGLRNSVLVALIVARAAHRNPATRGCHFREDHRPPQGAVPPPVA